MRQLGPSINILLKKSTPRYEAPTSAPPANASCRRCCL